MIASGFCFDRIVCREPANPTRSNTVGLGASERDGGANDQNDSLSFRFSRSWLTVVECSSRLGWRVRSRGYRETRVEELDTVAPGAFGSVQRCVGRFEQRFERHVGSV